MKLKLLVSTLAMLAFCAAPSFAAFAISQGPAGSNPVYTTTLGFDVAAPGNTNPGDFSGTGISSLASGTGVQILDDYTGLGYGENQSLFMPFGAFIDFAVPVDAVSIQAWETSGAASPFGGGAILEIRNQSDPQSGPPLWSAPMDNTGNNPDISFTATGGMSFDQIRIVGFGFPSADAYVDNLSFRAAVVPEPATSALGLIALLSFAGIIRRR